MIKKFNLFFLTFFLVGKIKHAPGTFASLVACFLFLLLVNITSIVVIFFIMLIIFCYFLSQEILSKKINIKGKTTEKLGLIGRGKAIASEVIVSVTKDD